MTLWVAYITPGQEFAVEDACNALGLYVAVPRVIELHRPPTQRKWQARERPYLPGYIFLRADETEWHWLRDVKPIRSMMGVTPSEERSVHSFIARVQADYDERAARIEAGDRVSAYAPGDLLTILTGPCAGRLARFRRMGDIAGPFPQIEAEIDMFGASVPARLDPIAARKAAE